MRASVVGRIVVAGVLCLVGWGIYAAVQHDMQAPAHWADVCTRSHTEVHYVYMTDANLIMTPHPVFSDVCTHYERRCVWGSKYDGPKECQSETE